MATHIYPTLRYHDARAAIDWLQEAFGFEPVASHDGPDGTVMHAELRWGDSMIMLGQETDERSAEWGERAGRGWNYVTVVDADAHHDQAKAAGAEIVRELTDQDYGSRDYGALDPEGNLWNFGTYDPLNG